MVIDTDDSFVSFDYNKFESWNPNLSEDDMTYAGPANSYLISATPIDYSADNFNVVERLTLEIGCTAACTFSPSADQTLDIVNNGLVKPYGGFLIADPNVYKSYKQTVIVAPGDNSGPTQGSQTVNNYGSGLNVTASIDASLTFVYVGATGGSFYSEDGVVDSALTSCLFGTLTPNEAKVCLFHIGVFTNAPNGFSIYVAQDQNMTFNGNTIKQFRNGTRIDDSSPAIVWEGPSTGAGAHLGYSSNDESVFPDVGGDAVWAGIPTLVAAGVAAANPVGLVANDSSPGIYEDGLFALKIEAGPGQPQAVSTLGQEYSNNLYFIVVGNF